MNDTRLMVIPTSTGLFRNWSALAYLVIGFMAGIIVAVVTGLSAVSLPSPSIPAAATSTSTSAPTDSGDVVVKDQAAGNSVAIESVTVPPPGVWVAVQEINEDASLGNVLGAVLVGHPESNVTVPLLRATQPAQEYAIVLYRDDGNGAFNLSDDSLYVDFDTGQRVEELFHTH